MTLDEEIKQAELDKKKAEITKELAEREKIVAEIKKLNAEEQDIKNKSKVAWWWRTNFLQFFITALTLLGIIGYVYVPYYEKQSILAKELGSLNEKKARYALDSAKGVIAFRVSESEKQERSVKHLLDSLNKINNIINKQTHEIAILKNQKSQTVKSSVSTKTVHPSSETDAGNKKLIWIKQNHYLKQKFFVIYDSLRIGLSSIYDGVATFNINKQLTTFLDVYQTVAPNTEFSIKRNDGVYKIYYIGPQTDSGVSPEPYALFNISKYAL